MRNKGSITVFLSLLFGLLFSFVLTALEAARIQGATAYVSMLTELAGDSFLASYYYPLFQEYHLFGVHAGDEKGYFSADVMEKRLEENISYGINEMEGGLLPMIHLSTELKSFETILSDDAKAFLSQVKEQVVLDEVSLMLSELFSAEMFEEAAVAGKIYRKQEETMTATVPVAKELLKLMELTDGILMRSDGLKLDKNGRLQCADAFLKQLLPIEKEKLAERIGNQEVFDALKNQLFRADEAAKQIITLIEKADGMQEEIQGMDVTLEQYNNQQNALWTSMIAVENLRKEAENAKETEIQKQYEKELELLELNYQGIKNLYKEVSNRRDIKVEERDLVLMDALDLYEQLNQKIQKVSKVLSEIEEVLDTLEEKQVTAQIAVKAYELFLEGMQDSVSKELYEGFQKELDTMKVYTGMKEQGYVVSDMRKSITQNKTILNELILNGFSDQELLRIVNEMKQVKSQMQTYTADYLWFTYGTITATQNTGQSVAGAVKELLTQGILELAGIEKENLSDRSLDGQELPSAVLSEQSLLDNLLGYMDYIIQLFQKEDLESVLKDSADAAITATALELYAANYFSCYGEETPVTKLNYEREYLLFGQKKDKENMFYMVLQLLAVRTLFCMVMLLKNPEKMTALQNLSAGVVGFTGMPALAAAAKYALLLLWSVEEALVEVAALLQGKKVAVVGSGGMISFTELFTFQKSLVYQKAKRLPETEAGAEYEDYVTLFSFLVPVQKKTYRVLDLIQENIRYQYLNHFRIRNVVTEICFQTQVRVKEKFDVGMFSDTAYELEWQEQCSY